MKFRAVVLVNRVAEFVNDHVVDQRIGQFHQLDVQGDVVESRTGSPTGVQVAYRHQAIPEAELSGQAGCSFGKIGQRFDVPCPLDSPADGILHLLGIVAESAWAADLDGVSTNAGADCVTGAGVKEKRMVASRVGRLDELLRETLLHLREGLLDPLALSI